MGRAQNERVQPRVKKKRRATVAVVFVVVASSEGNKAERRFVGAGVAVEPENELATYTRHTLTKPRTTLLFPFVL